MLTVSTPDFLTPLLLERMGMCSDGEAVHTRDTCTCDIVHVLYRTVRSAGLPYCKALGALVECDYYVS